MGTSSSGRPDSVAFVESYASDDRVVVKLIGELGASSLPPVERKLYDLADCADTTIDLARTSFSDLSSVRMLVLCRERARLNGRVLEVINAPPHVQRMLEMLERGHYWRPG